MMDNYKVKSVKGSVYKSSATKGKQAMPGRLGSGAIYG